MTTHFSGAVPVGFDVKLGRVGGDPRIALSFDHDGAGHFEILTVMQAIDLAMSIMAELKVAEIKLVEPS
jgi:hypothetical protein